MSLVCVRMTSFVNVGSRRCLNLPKKEESVTNVKINLEHFGMLPTKKPNFVSFLVDDDLGSNDARKVSGGFHEQVDINTSAVGTSQLGEGEQQLQG